MQVGEDVVDFLKAVASGVWLIVVVYCDLVGAAVGYLWRRVAEK
jgi:hypothetical protein